MDLGIRGRTALLSGASRGLGKACAFALAREGVDVTIVARTRDILERTSRGVLERAAHVETARQGKAPERLELGLGPERRHDMAVQEILR